MATKKPTKTQERPVLDANYYCLIGGKPHPVYRHGGRDWGAYYCKKHGFLFSYLPMVGKNMGIDKQLPQATHDRFYNLSVVRTRKDFDDWIVNGNVGQSSLTIWSVIKGITKTAPTIPRDFSDFERCYLLLKGLPIEMQHGLIGMVADKYPIWKPFYQHWTVMVECYENKEYNKVQNEIAFLNAKSNSYKLGKEMKKQWR